MELAAIAVIVGLTFAVAMKLFCCTRFFRNRMAD